MKRQKKYITPVHLIIPNGIHEMGTLDNQKQALIKKFFKNLPGLTFSKSKSSKACDIVSAIKASGQYNVLVLCQHRRINLISKDVSKELNDNFRTIFLVGFKNNHDFLSMVLNVSYALGAVGHTFPMLVRTYNGRTKRVE
jgi:hypothetical protein